MIRFLIGAVIGVGIILAIGTAARADGFGPDERAKGYGYTYEAPSTRAPSRKQYSCPPGITKRQCRIINEMAAQQRTGRRRPDPEPVRRNRRRYEPETRSTVERTASRHRCGDERFAGYGIKLPTMTAAKHSARESWRRIVRSELGELYLDIDNAVRVDMTCIPVGLFNRCTFKAVPCKG